jgi:aerobic-type carbon monoxide dehydrogenase small subunit (CoxS/CutS family)
MSARVRVTINDTAHEIETDPERSLLVVLREELGLTGAKYGCAEGECGACTVLVGHRARRACVEPVAGLDGRRVTTIEDLGTPELLHPVQEAWVETGALQCGYCTPGWIMATVGLLAGDADPDDDRIDAALDHNLCRCGAYPRIRRAVHRAAELSRGTPAGAVEVPLAREPERVPELPPVGSVPGAPWDDTGPGAGIFT